MKALLKNTRIGLGLKVKDLAALTGIDQALISKFESGSRLPTRTQLLALSSGLKLNQEELLTLWLKEKILAEIQYEPFAEKALNLVKEDLANYHKTVKPVVSQELTMLLAEIDALKAKLTDLRQYDSYRIAQALELEYTFESNRIEGNTLTLMETDLVINEGLTISGKSMREHLEAINHQEAISYIKELVQKGVFINPREVLTIHNLILRGINSEYAGKYRNVQVLIKGSKHIPPQPYLVEKEMEDYYIWYETNKHLLHPVLLAAEMHERLVTIHPFIDGNGRTSRLIMNLILLSHGYVIANIKGDSHSRMAYYSALENVQTNQDKEQFSLLVAQTEKDCLERYLSILS